MPRRKRLPPLPEPDPHGMWLFNPVDRTEIYIPFEVIHEDCKMIMDPRNARLVEQELGKVDWRNDPTYHMRKK